MLYLLYGPDEYARQEYIRELARRTGLPRVDYSEGNVPTDGDVLFAADLFTGGQVVVLENLLQQFITEDTVAQFAESTNHIVFVEPGLDRRTKLAKALLSDKRVSSKECAAPSATELPGFITKYVSDRNARMADSTTRVLLQRLGYIDPVGGQALALRVPAVGRLQQELNKLITYAGQADITADAVRALVPDERDTLGFAITDSIQKKNKKELFTMLDGYYMTGSDDDTTKTLQLVGLLAENFRAQLLVKDALEQRIPEPEILEKTGWKSGRLFVAKRMAATTTMPKLRDVLTKLELLDIELKTTTTPPRVVLELILAQAM